MNEELPSEMSALAPASPGVFEGSPAPNVLIALGAVALYFVAQMLVGVVLIVAFMFASGKPFTDPTELMSLSRNGLLNGLVVLIAVLLSLPIIYAVIVKVDKRPFGEVVRWRPPVNLPAWMGIVVALVVGVAFDALTLALGKPLVPQTLRDLYQGGVSDVAILALAVVVAAPLMEEILFRGLLYTSLSARIGVPAGITITTLTFGVVHVCTYGTDWYSILQTLVMGLILTLLRAWTRSLWPCTVAHVTNNLYSTVEILVLLSLNLR
jgi:uncharacterized protein